MDAHALINRIQCELDANDPEFAANFLAITQLMDRLQEKGFSPEEAHLLGASPELLRDVLKYLHEELPVLDRPYMTVAAVDELIEDVKSIIKKCKRGDLSAEAAHLERVAGFLHQRKRLLEDKTTGR